MKLVYDPWMIRDQSFSDICRFAADIGYVGLELSPRDDFLPLFEWPQGKSDSIRELKDALKNHQLELASMWTVYRWAEPNDAEACRSAVDSFKRFVEVANELECTHISSEFGGDFRNVSASKSAFLKSIDSILPTLSKYDITLSLDPHPGDWVEDGREAIDLIREINHKNLRFLYSIPHTFYLDRSNEIQSFIEYVGPDISFVRAADTFDHRPQVRYIVNPLGAPVRVHQHLNIGEGEIDWQKVFESLSDIGYDGFLSNSVFAWPDRARESAEFMFTRMNQLCSENFGIE